MSGTWYPGLRDQVIAECRLVDQRALARFVHELDGDSVYEPSEVADDSLDALNERLLAEEYAERSWLN